MEAIIRGRCPENARLGHLALAAVIAILWAYIGQAAETNLQADVESVLAEEGLVGIAWTLVGENDNVRFGSAGLRDNASRSDFTADTRFHVGSLTKSLLATGVLRLVTEGKIDLDAPASRYLENISFNNPFAGQSVVTVRHLLDHTSGLDDANLWQMFSERAEPDTPLVVAFSEPETQLRIRSQPGSRLSYSNMGYTLLGMIVESVVGERYETYLDEYVLEPLGMVNSTFTFTTQVGENADLTLAWGHVDDGSRYAAAPVFLRPAGQFTSTTADLAKFAQFLLSDGALDDQVFVDVALMRSRGHPSTTEAANNGLVAGYALGLGRRDRHGVVGYCHGGNVVGFVAMLCIFPEEHKAFAYSVNTDSETADYGRLERLFVGALQIDNAAPPQTVSLVSDISQWHGRYVLNPNRFQMFKYLDTVFGAINISAAGDMLSMTALQQGPRQLRPTGIRIYSASNRTTSSHVLLRGDAGEYLISDGFRTYEKVSSMYLLAHWVSVFLGLIGMAWLLLAGAMSLIRYRSDAIRRPEAPAFIAIALLFLPIPFFMTQSFMALGDFTLASALLAAVTLLLPLGMFVTVLLANKTCNGSRINRLHGLSAVFVLQWCAVLIAAGMLPLRLWI
jgi:CubicO group peptidase (beta-lactamase class C family)